MQIINLTPEFEELYFLCLEDWSDEIREAGDHKARWYAQMKEQGLRVKLALDNSGTPGGMIQYLPVEHSRLAGKECHFIHCIWVHGYKQGRGNFQKKGMGKALLQAAEEDAAQLGSRGIAAWGVALPFWMKASWFRKQGYRVIDRDGIARLLWKPLAGEAEPPRFIRPKCKPERVPGKVSVTGLLSGACPAQSLVIERASRAAAELGEQVTFQYIDTSRRETFLEWGMEDALFIDGRRVNTGPPPSYAALKKRIAKRLKKLQKDSARD